MEKDGGNQGLMPNLTIPPIPNTHRRRVCKFSLAMASQTRDSRPCSIDSEGLSALLSTFVKAFSRAPDRLREECSRGRPPTVHVGSNKHKQTFVSNLLPRNTTKCSNYFSLHYSGSLRRGRRLA